MESENTLTREKEKKIETQEEYDAWYIEKINSAKDYSEIWENVSDYEREIMKKFKPTVSAELIFTAIKNTARFVATEVVKSLKEEAKDKNN